MSAAEPAASVRTRRPGPAGRGERTTGAYNRRSMQRFLLERRIRDVHTRLVRAREELAVLDEQLAVVADEAEEARLRSLVSETPLAAHEYAEVKRHADAMHASPGGDGDGGRRPPAPPGRAADARRYRSMTPPTNGNALAAERAVDPSAGDPSTAERTPTRVVIAEDEAIIRLDLKEILLTAGYDVVGETGRGDEAVTLVEQHQPDLVILDVKMPGMDGVRAARAITTSSHKVAVLILTAFSQRDLIDEARDAGVAAYLVKPFRRDRADPGHRRGCRRCEQEWAIEDEIAALARDGGDREHGRGQDRDPPRRRRGQGGPDGPLRPVRGRRLRASSSGRPWRPGPGCSTSPAGRRRRRSAPEVTPAGQPRPGSRDRGSGESRGGPLLLLDGMSLAFRAYFALPPDLVTTTGVVTNAVHGFISMLVNLVRDHRPDWPGRGVRPARRDLPRRDRRRTTRRACRDARTTCCRSSR